MSCLRAIRPLVLIGCTSIVSTIASSRSVWAQEQLDTEPTPLNKQEPASVDQPSPNVPSSDLFPGTWKFGGALRARIDANYQGVDPVGKKTPTSYFSFDTLALKLSYDSDTFFFGSQYRFYDGGSYPFTRVNGYKGYFGEINFPVFAFIGYKFTKEDNVVFGINEVPFGLQPLFTSTFYSSIGYYMGVEEVYNTGVKYTHVEPDINYQLGYYPGAAPNGFGVGTDNTRYSVNLTRAPSYDPIGVNNREENIFVGRIEKLVYKDSDATLTLGGSLWHSSIYNFDTTRTGFKQLESVHAIGTYGNWTTRLIYVRQDILPKNPYQNSIVTVGSLDFSYNMAARGNFFSADINYKINLEAGPLSDITPYFNYSAYVKDRANFKTTERYIVGASLTSRDIPGLIIYTEARIGRNDPYTGDFLNGLGAGGTNKFKTVYYTSIGYYW